MCNETLWKRVSPLSRVYTRCARMRAYTRVYARIRAYTRAYADCRRSCLYFCRRLRPAHTRAYADCRRQSSNMLNFQGQRRPAQAFQPITKAPQGHRGPARCSAKRRMRTYTDTYARLFILLSTAQLALCSGDAQAAASVDICAGCRCKRAHGV